MCEVTRLALRVISDPWLERSLLEAQRTLVGTGSVANDPMRSQAGSKSRSAAVPPVLFFLSKNGRHQAVKRREFITLLGGAAAAWPLTTSAQQSAMTTIGYLSTRSPGEAKYVTDAFTQGLKETGYVEGRNLAIEFRWAELDYDRLPALASDLVRRQVEVIAAVGGAHSGSRRRQRHRQFRSSSSALGTQYVWSRLQPEPTGRQRYGRKHDHGRTGVKATGTAARVGARSCRDRYAH